MKVKYSWLTLNKHGLMFLIIMNLLCIPNLCSKYKFVFIEAENIENTTFVNTYQQLKVRKCDKLAVVALSFQFVRLGFQPQIRVGLFWDLQDIHITSQSHNIILIKWKLQTIHKHLRSIQASCHNLIRYLLTWFNIKN